MEDKLSTLEVGKLADVFVVEGNPLEGFDALSSAVSPPQAKWSSGQRSLPGPPRRQGNADLWPVAAQMQPRAGTPTVQSAPLARERRPLASSPGGGRHRPPEAGETRTPDASWVPNRVLLMRLRGGICSPARHQHADRPPRSPLLLVLPAASSVIRAAKGVTQPRWRSRSRATTSAAGCTLPASI